MYVSPRKATIKLVAKALDLQNYNIYYFDVSVNLRNNSVLLIYILLIFYFQNYTFNF